MPTGHVIYVRHGSFGARIAVIALAGLGIRLLYILVIAPVPIGVGGDGGFYHSAANLIADGHFYYRRIFGHAHATAEHPPLYPLLLSLVSLTGSPGRSLLAQRIAGCVIGAVSVALIGFLGRRIGGERAGVVAASIAALYPPLVTADGLVMSEPLFVAAVTLALLTACRLSAAPELASPARPIRGARPRHVLRPPRGLRWAIALGTVIGLGTLTRSEGLLLLPLLAWPLAWAPASGRARRLIACTAAVAVVLAPWVIRNAVVFHRLTLATDSSTVIAGANCADTYYGYDIGWWSPGCLALAQERGQLLSGDASPSPGLRYAREHLTRLPLVAAVRTLRTFDFFQPLRQGNHERRRRWVDVAGLAFYFPLVGLALAGLAGLAGLGSAGVGRRGPPGRSLGVGQNLGRVACVLRARTLLLAPIWLAVIVSVLGWGIGRFRVAADVSLIVLAACAVAGLRGRDGGPAPGAKPGAGRFARSPKRRPVMNGSEKAV